VIWRYEYANRNDYEEGEEEGEKVFIALYRGPDRVGELYDVVLAGEICDRMNQHIEGR
jgi:hypothetical protein